MKSKKAVRVAWNLLQSLDTQGFRVHKVENHLKGARHATAGHGNTKGPAPRTLLEVASRSRCLRRTREPGNKSSAIEKQTGLYCI